MQIIFLFSFVIRVISETSCGSKIAKESSIVPFTAIKCLPFTEPNCTNQAVPLEKRKERKTLAVAFHTLLMIEDGISETSLCAQEGMAQKGFNILVTFVKMPYLKLLIITKYLLRHILPF